MFDNGFLISVHSVSIKFPNLIGIDTLSVGQLRGKRVVVSISISIKFYCTVDCVGVENNFLLPSFVHVV